MPVCLQRFSTSIKLLCGTLLLLLCACRSTDSAVDNASWLFTADRYRTLQAIPTTLSVRGKEMSGTLLLKSDAQDTLRGTLVNETGYSALSFTVNPQRTQVKLNAVLAFINHWYIRKVLRNDLRLLFSTTTQQEGLLRKQRMVQRDTLGNLVLRNHRFHITYTFQLSHATAYDTQK